MNYSTVDSKRFDLNIFRDNIDEIPSDLLAQLYQNKVDVAILRLPSKKQHELHTLDEMGIPFVAADTLVEYSTKANSKEVRLMNADIRIYEPVTESDWNDVDVMVVKCFDGYSNHYFSNPYLDKIGNIEGYKEWVRSCAGDQGVVYIVENAGTKVGFFSVAFKDGVANGAPGGIIPEYEAGGLYLDFHKMLPSLIQQKGLKLLKTSTQVQNLMVQRQWTMSGWNFTSSSLTLHLNVFIGRALNGTKTTAPFTQNNLLHFISENIDIKFDQLRIKEIQSLEKGKSYEISISSPIKNVTNNRHCVSVVITENEKLAAIAWLDV